MKRVMICAGFGAALLLAGCASTKEKNPEENEAAPTSAGQEQKPEHRKVAMPPPKEVKRPYDETLTLEGITFRVQCPNEGSLNPLTITPHGLMGGNAPLTVEADGSVVGSEVADLDADGSPEIYVYVQSAGSGSYGSLVAYACNNRKSLSEIHLPELSANKELSDGYMGHDEFAVVEGVLARRFPLYFEGDSNADSSGYTRQLQYKLLAGEAGWKLILDKAVDF